MMNREHAEKPGNALRLIACPHILSVEKGRIDVERPVGGTIRDLLRSIGWTQDCLSARVFIDGVFVQDAEWERVVPHAGQSVIVRAIPVGGGGGGGQGKDALRIVAMIAVVVASIYTAGAAGAAMGGLLGVSAATGGAIAGAAVSIVGTLAVNALIPPARPKLNDLSGLTNTSNTLSLNGTSNQLIPYGVVPRVYGRHRIFPPLAAKHYTEVVGDDQYIRALFCLGPGPLALSDFRIGENTLDLFTGVELEVHQGYPTDPPHTLYPAVVIEEPLSIPIDYGTSTIRTSKDSAGELSVDFTFLSLWIDHKSAGPQPNTVQILVQYRKQGDVTWIVANDAPSVPASLTTVLTGLHNDLVFTQTGFGSSSGNNLAISYVDRGDQASETVEATPNGPQAFVFIVGLRKISGVYSTASQIKTFLDSAIFTNYETNHDDPFGDLIAVGHAVTEYLSIALAPGNDGTGVVTVMDPSHCTGGLDGTDTLTVTATRFTRFRKSLHWHTPAPGIYEVRVERLTPKVPGGENYDDFFWTTLRTIRSGVNLIPSGLASIAIRIKATDQLNGTLDAFNCVAESILPDWNGQQWVPRLTNNPASIFRDVHQGTITARPKADSRMDLATIQAFHARCAALGFHFNAILDFRSTVAELSRDVLAAGRATQGYRDGKISVVEDVPQTVHAQLLTPRNSWGFSATKVFADLPHALKVRFANADTLQQDERVVIADGYGVTGTDGIRRDAFGAVTTWPEATRFESVEAGLGVNDLDQIFKLQRYHLAALALRPETYRLSCDFEHLTMLRGDLVMVQHDVPLFGLISGRIKAVTLDGIGRTSAITLDEPCVMELGQRYGVRIRLQDGTQIQSEVETVVGAQTTLTLVEPI